MRLAYALQRWVMENFTWRRWRVNPFQMYATASLLLVSTAQMGFGVLPSSPSYNLYDNTQLALAFCAFWGSLLVLFGLHLKDLETALWMEMCGYLSVMCVEGLSVYLMFATQELAFTTHMFAYDQFMVYASLQRSIHIWLYKRARRRRVALSKQIKALKEVMRRRSDDIDPDCAVFGDGDSA